MTEPDPVYTTRQIDNTDNPFEPYLTDGDIVYIKSELDELFPHPYLVQSVIRSRGNR